ncbi:hypothetical protein CKO51_01880 [Rhodopirellula sp. SM50]|nr:hypothetical protein CKO51_01880 [Rhodopirellula sp. SM50]
MGGDGVLCRRETTVRCNWTMRLGGNRRYRLGDLRLHPIAGRSEHHGCCLTPLQVNGTFQHPADVVGNLPRID